MSFITTRRLASLVSASAMVATVALAAGPTAALAAGPTSGETGFFRDGKNLTAAQIGGVVTGELDATGFDIAVYNPTNVKNADIHDATYYGVVVNGLSNINTTGSKVHDIGESPLNGAQHGNAILYINGASGMISGNKVYDFQKNGITVSGKAADGIALSDDKTSASVANNIVTGEGHIDYIAQNGIQISYGARAAVNGNTVRDIFYTGDDEACGLLSWDAGKVTVSGNTFVDTEVSIYGEVTADVQGTSTTKVRPHGVRVDLRSDAQPAAETVIGDKLDWKVKVDGRVQFHTRQGFGDHDVYRQHFTDGSGRHVIKVLANGELVERTVVRF